MTAQCHFLTAEFYAEGAGKGGNVSANAVSESCKIAVLRLSVNAKSPGKLHCAVSSSRW